MKVFFYIIIIVSGGFFWTNAQATLYQAQFRERWVIATNHVFPVGHSYGGDQMARLKRHILDQGFFDASLTLRLAMASRTASEVSVGRFRSNNKELEVLANNFAASGKKLTLKPLIQIGLQTEVIQQSAGINPSSLDRWFSTYALSLSANLQFLRRHQIKELVLGSGLNHLWTAGNGERWIHLMTYLERKSGKKLPFSIEVGSDADLRALLEWERTDTKSFETFRSNLTVIRLAANFKGDLSWLERIKAKKEALHQLFDEIPIYLSNVYIPSCGDFSYEAAEIKCRSPWAFEIQNKNLKTFFERIKALEAEGTTFRLIELVYANTDFEPPQSEIDARFLYSNHAAWPLIKEKLNEHTNSYALDQSQLVRGLAENKKRVCIYYDQLENSDSIGLIHAKMLANLIGAFPDFEETRRRSADYKSGDFKSCYVVFYNGTNFFQKFPPKFLTDLAEFSRSRSVIWMNYKFDSFFKANQKFATRSESDFLEFNSVVIRGQDASDKKQKEDKGFFQIFKYKDETFFKKVFSDPSSDSERGAFELNHIFISDPSRVEVFSTAVHSKTQEEVPYVVRQKFDQGSIWFVGDSPFSFIHEEDRYLIFCDLLWDMLEISDPPKGPLGALVRLEDISPSLPTASIKWAVDYLIGSEKVPVSLALIPYFSDQFGISGVGGRAPVYRPISQFKSFVSALRYARARGASFVMHGVAHSSTKCVSGYDGVTGDDYEFWLYPENSAIPGDSADFVIGQLELGEKVLRDLQIPVSAWETPHYASSALATILFAKLFEWTYHRTLYFGPEVARWPRLEAKHQLFRCQSAACKNERLQEARNLKVLSDSSSFQGQFFPYIIWKDVYGQRIIPESLGAVDNLNFRKDTWRPVKSAAAIVSAAKKLRVVRGSIASFFWHPSNVNLIPLVSVDDRNIDQNFGRNTLIEIVQGIKKLGYNFVSIDDCAIFPRSSCPAQVVKN